MRFRLQTRCGLLVFDRDTGHIEVYLERLECFIAANDIAGEKKLQVYLTTICDKAYGTLRSLLLPKTPTKVTFEDAVGALKKHYTPKSSVVTEKYRFHQRKQEKHESVSNVLHRGSQEIGSDVRVGRVSTGSSAGPTNRRPSNRCYLLPTARQTLN
ncbi:hypothetical protein HPB49_013310 [Dermacentor silvarum]|uniref:Uncharacterized protein n=1 Tax=Dermacentor silvarum TaxID=543639 RepID=A0ACB8D5S6_DERSI|nr:hypothetical protein HPB49_013310 [Dermacentor silvarum]